MAVLLLRWFRACCSLSSASANSFLTFARDSHALKYAFVLRIRFYDRNRCHWCDSSGFREQKVLFRRFNQKIN